MNNLKTTMNAKEYNKVLLSLGIGKLSFGRSGNQMFDDNFALVKYDNFIKAHESAVTALDWYEYKKDYADCENYAFMAYGIHLTWMLKNVDRNSACTMGPTWGWWEGTKKENKHAWNFALTDRGLIFANYRDIATPSYFKSIGSISA